MTNVLVLNQHSAIAQTVVKRLKARANFHVTTLNAVDFKRAASYVGSLADQNVIAAFLGPMDVDLDFEALFDAIDQVQPPLRQFLMLSHAGVADEVSGRLKYSGVKDVKEYFNEQRYAAKVVDESEIPYTILRPVDVTMRSATKRPSIIEAGRAVPAGQVSYQNVARVASEVLIDHRYVNQSIAIIDQK